MGKYHMGAERERDYVSGDATGGGGNIIWWWLQRRGGGAMLWADMRDGATSYGGSAGADRVAEGNLPPPTTPPVVVTSDFPVPPSLKHAYRKLFVKPSDWQTDEVPVPVAHEPAQYT